MIISRYFILVIILNSAVNLADNSQSDKYDIVILGGGSSSYAYLYKILQEYGFSVSNPVIDREYRNIKILVISDGQDESTNDDLMLAGDPNYISLTTKRPGDHNPIHVFQSREDQRQAGFTYRQTQANGGISEVGSPVIYWPISGELEEWGKYICRDYILSRREYGNCLESSIRSWNYSSVSRHIRNLESFRDHLHPSSNISSISRGYSGIIDVMKNNAVNDSNLFNLNLRFSSSTNSHFIRDINEIGTTSRIGLSETDRPFKYLNISQAVKSSIYRSMKNIIPNIVKIESLSTIFGVKMDRRSHQSSKIREILYQNGGSCQSAKIKSGGRVILGMGITGSSKFVESIGIGNCSYLSGLGIDCVKNLPYVGNNLQDHPYFISTHLPIVSGLSNRDAGIMSVEGNDVPVYRWMNDLQTQNLTSLDFDNISRDNMGINSRLSTWRLSYLTSKTEFGIPVLIVIYTNLQAISSGSIHIQNSNHLSKPRIEMGYSISSVEMDRMMYMFNLSRQILSSNYTELSPGQTVSPSLNKDQMRSAIYNILDTNYHGVGTLMMGKTTDIHSLRVFGTDNLYCVDSSVHPHPPLSNPLGTILAVSTEIASRHFKMFGY